MKPIRPDHLTSSWLRRVGIAAVSAVVLFVACAEKKPAATAPVPIPVVVARVVAKDVPVQIRAIGVVEAYSMVAVKTQITGLLTEVHFKEGDDVTKGQLLFTLDQRPYEADVKRAEANLARDLAQAENARVQARRYAALMKDGVVAKEQYDNIQAQADQFDAVVAADRAQVEYNKVQLQYCSIYSPINGRTGYLVVHMGNEVKANDNPALVTINQVTPIYVAFSVPEQQLGDIKKHSTGPKLVVEAYVPNDPEPVRGTLSFLDNAVDNTTGTIKLKGVFDNLDHRLWPGQFTNAVLTLETQPNAVVIPSQAVQTGQQGQFVFVIRPDMTAEARPVEVLRTVADQSVITKGVQPGEQVVTDGQVRLLTGSKVEIRGGGAAAQQAAADGKPQGN